MSARDESPQARIAMTPADFRAVGHALVEEIAAFYESLRTVSRPVTRGHAPEAVRALLGGGALPASGTPAAQLAAVVAPLLFDHALHNGHPRFMGYITSSPRAARARHGTSARPAWWARVATHDG